MTARHASDCRCWECIARENGPSRFTGDSKPAEASEPTITIPRKLLERASRVLACASTALIADGDKTFLDVRAALATPAPPVAAAPGVVASDTPCPSCPFPEGCNRHGECRVDYDSRQRLATPPASPEVLAEPVATVWFEIVKGIADHAKENAAALRKVPGSEHEARARELGAQYLLESAQVMLQNEHHAIVLGKVVDSNRRLNALRKELEELAPLAEPVGEPLRDIVEALRDDVVRSRNMQHHAINLQTVEFHLAQMEAALASPQSPALREVLAERKSTAPGLTKVLQDVVLERSRMEEVRRCIPVLNVLVGDIAATAVEIRRTKSYDRSHFIKIAALAVAAAESLDRKA